MDEKDLAIVDLNKAIELDPNNAYYYHERGYTYLDKGEYVLALADFNKALELDPNNAMHYRGRGSVYMRMGENELAIADFEKALELAQLAQNLMEIQWAQQALEQLGAWPVGG